MKPYMYVQLGVREVDSVFLRQLGVNGFVQPEVGFPVIDGLDPGADYEVYAAAVQQLDGYKRILCSLVFGIQEQGVGIYYFK